MDPAAPAFPYSVVIPPDVCRLLGLTRRDALCFEVRDGEVVLKKAPLLDASEPADHEYRALAVQSMTEWLDEIDEGLLSPWGARGTL